MATPYDLSAPKRPVNLTLNEDLVTHARKCTDNLSGLVESLLADFIGRERQRRAAEVKLAQATCAMWNRFDEKFGSFADEHSTL
ncbi:MAG: type II toxin-antitoxin system CcdA family antitoxin [Steroidobacteraceae bacterium]